MPVTFNGDGVGGLWTDKDNWDLGRIPESGDDVVIGGMAICVLPAGAVLSVGNFTVTR